MNKINLLFNPKSRGLYFFQYSRSR